MNPFDKLLSKIGRWQCYQCGEKCTISEVKHTEEVNDKAVLICTDCYIKNSKFSYV